MKAALFCLGACAALIVAATNGVSAWVWIPAAALCGCVAAELERS